MEPEGILRGSGGVYWMQWKREGVPAWKCGIYGRGRCPDVEERLVALEWCLHVKVEVGEVGVSTGGTEALWRSESHLMELSGVFTGGGPMDTLTVQIYTRLLSFFKITIILPCLYRA